MASKCSLCGTEHEPWQAHVFAPREVNHQAGSDAWHSRQEVVALKAKLDMSETAVAECHAEIKRLEAEVAALKDARLALERELMGLQKPKSDRREYMREYMRKRRAKERGDAAQARNES